MYFFFLFSMPRARLGAVFFVLQRPLWQWRVVFMSRLGVTALDGLAKTKESDKVLGLRFFEVVAVVLAILPSCCR